MMVDRARGAFVGRAAELAELVRALDSARAGRGAAVLVGGPAGIGKTRLVAELAQRSEEAGAVVLLGHSLDLAGTELPYHPFVEALRPWGQPWADGGETGFSHQLRVFERTLSALEERTSSRPVLLVLEDVHWADTSSTDLIGYLAHNLARLPVLLVATARTEEFASRDRIRTLADSIRRSAHGLLLDVGPLDANEALALVEDQSSSRLPSATAETIVTRSEGNPFFVEELLTAATSDGDAQLPPSLRDLLLLRTSGLDRETLDLLRVAAVVGRNVPYVALQTTAGAPETVVREQLRRAVDRGILVADPDSSVVRFRHALLAEAVYATVLPGEREDFHCRVATYLTTVTDTPPAELARHWTLARRPDLALPASIAAARRAEAMSGMAEALGHLERAIRLWDQVPQAAKLAGLDLAELCAWAAQLADYVGADPRSVELARRAIELTPDESWQQLALLHGRLGEYLFGSSEDGALLGSLGRAVALTHGHPESSEAAYALASLAGGLMVARRFGESLPMAREALDLARAVGARTAEVRALTVLGSVLVHSGHTDAGVCAHEEALSLAQQTGDLISLERCYVNFTDILTILGRQRAAVDLATDGTADLRRRGVVSQVLTANHVEALFLLGDWDEADHLSASAVRARIASFPYAIPLLRADLDTGRGDFASARTHLATAGESMRPDHEFGILETSLAELALWERRWTDADRLLRDARARASTDANAYLRVGFCAKALRSRAELAAIDPDRGDTMATRSWTLSAEQVIAETREAADLAARVTPNAHGWLALAEGEYSRAVGSNEPKLWAVAASAWDELERPPLAAYCRWRLAEALVDTRAATVEAAAPLRSAYAVATRLRAKPLIRELATLARRGRITLRAVEPPQPTDPNLSSTFGLTPREGEVLQLIAQGCTNREIARTLVISEKTTGVHVTHILRKLDVLTRVQAAAIAHRWAPLLKEASSETTARS